MGAVRGFVDPGPVIKEHLAALAAEYEPRITELNEKVRSASSADARAVQRELRAVKREYAVARRRVRALHRGRAHW